MAEQNENGSPGEELGFPFGGRFARAHLLFMAVFCAAAGIGALFLWKLVALGMAFFLFGKAYSLVYFSRASSRREPADGSTEWPRELRITGLAYIIGAALLCLSVLTGSNWGWLLMAALLLQGGIVYYFGPKLLPSVPARWFP